jgi:Mrp family chromosome partitioning ATPase
MSASAAVSVKTAEAVPSIQGAREREASPCAPKAQVTATRAASLTAATESYEVATFAQEQLRGLIQRIFFPGWPKASRQVVVSSADAQAESSVVCARILREMAKRLPGTVCAVEANVRHPGVSESLGSSISGAVGPDHNTCLKVQENLWLAGPCSLFDPKDEGFDTVCVRSRLSGLRRNFDYSLIHAPAAFLAETIVLGQFAYGVILVIQAGKTRRAVVRTTLTSLKAAKVVVLGTVLTDRTFPVPQALYRRL